MVEPNGASILAQEEVLDADYDAETVDAKEYVISGYGADFDVEGLVRRLKRRDIDIPSFQRAYVWNHQKASRFIESLLMGLPVPGIFLYRERGSQRMFVIDGQQRLKTLQFYYDGKIGDSESAFALKGLKSRFEGLTYDDLTDEDRRRLDDSIIRASIIHQEAPDDDGSSRYSIFERLNTSSTPLTPQEIRSAIYGGALNRLIEDLNNYGDWRALFGRRSTRKRDEELILRFLALYFYGDEYKSPMKGFLNTFMKNNRELGDLDEQTVKSMFEKTVTTMRNTLGDRAIKPDRQVNAAVADAIMVAVARALEAQSVCSEPKAAYQSLMKNQDFLDAVSAGTSQPVNVRKRIGLATQAFAGAN